MNYEQPTIVIVVRGGNVDDVVANVPGMQRIIVDYDNEACAATVERKPEPLRCDKQRVAALASGQD